MNLSQWDLANYLKKKDRFMSAKEIAKETHSTLTSVNRKLNALYPRTIKKKIKKVKVGKCYCKRPVSYFRFRK